MSSLFQWSWREEIPTAGINSQRQVTALLRHRERTRARDAVIDASSKVEELRANYQARLAAAQTERGDTIKRRQELLAAAAVVVGDDTETARLLDLPVRHVRDARRAIGANAAGQLIEQLCTAAPSERTASRTKGATA